MHLRDLIRISFKALNVNRNRSALTMLGIVIGISSVILMLSVGQAAQQFLLSQVASFGSDAVFVANGKGNDTRGGAPSADTKQTLTEKDYKALKALPWPKAVNANIITSDLLTYGGANMRVQVVGSTPDELVIYNTGMSQGRYLDQNDLDSHSRVVIIGQNVEKNLYGEAAPVNTNLKIGTQTFHVIGVLAPAGTRFFSNVDDEVYIPYTASMDLYHNTHINFLTVKTGSTSPSQAQTLIRIRLREMHNINNPNNDLSKDDFKVATQEDAVQRTAVISNILQLLLGSIASISLVVAGIGIMNIMYVTVTERTREIGLRKALGAKHGDILKQFLFEAILLTSVAGIIGIIFGTSVAYLAILVISHIQAGWSFVMPWSGAAIAFTVSALIGIIFGYFPARRAAKLNPIEALRYE